LIDLVVFPRIPERTAQEAAPPDPELDAVVVPVAELLLVPLAELDGPAPPPVMTEPPVPLLPAPLPVGPEEQAAAPSKTKEIGAQGWMLMSPPLRVETRKLTNQDRALRGRKNRVFG
jgi:hypothetical protein